MLPYLATAGKVLDCGCGPGSLTRELASRFPNSTFVGIEIESTRIALAHENAPRNATFIEASLYSLPFDDESCDVVYSNAVFQHLNDPTTALLESLRVLAMDGILAIRVPDWSGLLTHPASPKVQDAISRFLSIHYAPECDPRIGSKLPSLAIANGFDVVEFSVDHEMSDPNLMFTNLANVLRENKFFTDANVLANCVDTPGGVFSQSWCQLVARKPADNKKMHRSSRLAGLKW